MAWNRRRAAAIHQATVNLSSKKKDGQDVAAGFNSFLLSVSSFSFLRKNLRRIEYEKYVYLKFARIKGTTWNISLRWNTFSSILLGSIKPFNSDATNRKMIFKNNFGTLLYNNLFLSISRYL